MAADARVGARMARTERLLNLVIAEQKLPATVAVTTDQRAALAGADYVIVTIMVGGFGMTGQPWTICAGRSRTASAWAQS